MDEGQDGQDGRDGPSEIRSQHAGSRRDHRRGGAIGARGRHHRQDEQPRLSGARAGRARQFDLPVSAADGVLHDTGAARDRRAAVHVAVREAHARRGAELLPEGRRQVRSADRVRRDRDGDCAWRRISSPSRHFVARREARARGAARRDRHRLLRSAGHARHSRRRPAARPSLLQRAPSLLPPARRRGRRRKFRRRVVARDVSRGRARDDRASPQRVEVDDQVLGAARHRQPHQGRVDRRAVQHVHHRDPPDVRDGEGAGGP